MTEVRTAIVEPFGEPGQDWGWLVTYAEMPGVRDWRATAAAVLPMLKRREQLWDCAIAIEWRNTPLGFVPPT